MASVDPVRRQPSFWNELYWFAVIALGGWILAVAVLPPRAGHYRELLEIEGRLAQRKAQIERQGDELEAAIISMANDPVYRESVYRKVVKPDKIGEEILELSAPTDR